MKPEEMQAIRARLHYVLYAERVTRVLCRRSGAVPEFEWRADPREYSVVSDRRSYWTRKTSHRTPPLPFHSLVHKGPGTCRVCGQPIYGRGSFRKFAGPVSPRLTWHSVCFMTYDVMTKPNNYAAALIIRQGQVCAVSGAPIPLPYRDVEVDHEVPLYRVGRDHADEPWHELIRFWMTGNLRAVTRDAHLAKCAEEARERAGRVVPTVGQEAML